MLATLARTQEGARRMRADVRFGSKADICAAKRHVRFAPNSDRESGFSQTVMSALPTKADVCGALTHVCFGPKADIRFLQWCKSVAQWNVRNLHQAVKRLVQF